MKSTNNKKGNYSLKQIIGIPLLMAFTIFTVIVLIIVLLDNRNDNMANTSSIDNTKIETKDSSNEDPNSSLNETPKNAEQYNNADTFFNDFGKVLSVKHADEETSLIEEANVKQFLNERNLNTTDIYTHYSIAGEYYDDKIIMDDSSVKHPMYETSYINDNNEEWELYIINDQLMANPVSYNSRYYLENEKMVIVSEKESIISYDCETNQFYEVIPKESEMKVYKVDKIDSNALDEITVERILNYVED